MSDIGGEIVSARIVEAMRLGVVPIDDVRTYTVGRAEERRQVDRDLDRVRQKGGALRALLGDYGTGKTHMLEIVRQRALEQGFVVGEVVLDPEESAPSHPKRVYRRLIRSLEYPDDASAGGGLRPLLDRACGRPEVLESFLAHVDRKPVRDDLDEGAHLYLTPALRYWGRLTRENASARSGLAFDRTNESDVVSARELLLDWLEGETDTSTGEIDDTVRETAGDAGKIYCMMDYRPWARIYGYLVSGLSTLASRLGYGGLVVLFDEAEFYSLLSKQNRAYARTLFKAYARAATPGAASDLPFETAELDLGGYGVQQDLPTRYHPEPNLYTVFAMTPHEEGRRALGAAVPPDRTTELSPLGEPEYEELTRRVVDHYRRANDPDDDVYDAVLVPLTKLVEGLRETGFLENPRAAMKFVVDFLDLARHERAQIAAVIDDLRGRLTR